ncbi:MAG: bacillithiol biosynthesis cysteine-adding enzyme BshC [Planctomycetes bacterium]|nr:bacillithiol biosynthesis cysteine-adding enzyme BshC [Planctomycetota bacterium]
MISSTLVPLELLALPPFASRAQHVPGIGVPRTLEDIAPREDEWLSEERMELALALERGIAAHQPHVAVLDGVRQLAQPGACCVITGQQPGFLGGPLYSLLKALHAIRLSRSLAQAWERPVVPLFWNHADDHDIAELHHAWVLNENLDLQRLGLAGLSSGKQPVSRIVLREDKQHLSAVREALRQLYGRQPFGESAIELFLPRDGETFATAFTRAMTDVLGPHGLVMLEPDWIREPLSRALARIVARPELASALASGEAHLLEHGAPVAIESATAALLYRVDERGRHALRVGGDGFRYDGEDGSRTGAEVAAEIVRNPTDWSAGALLRPLLQDSVLPSVAYVGGWSELNYLAQLGPLRDAVGVARTAAVPRWSATLVEAETADAAAQLGVELHEVLASRGKSIAADEQAPPPPVVAELRELGLRAARELVSHRPALAELDRGLAANLPRTGDQIRSLIEKLCERAERVHANRTGRGRRLVRRVTNALCPRGELQERVLSALPFLARHGTEWVGELLDTLTPLSTAHLLVRLSPTKSNAEPAP